MSKKVKIAIIIVAAVVLLTVAYFVVFKKKTGGEEADTKDPFFVNPVSHNNDLTFPIAKGAKGKQVKHLQKWLNNTIDARLTVDGNWGSKTQEAFERALVKDSGGQITGNSLSLNAYEFNKMASA